MLSCSCSLHSVLQIFPRDACSADSSPDAPSGSGLHVSEPRFLPCPNLSSVLLTTRPRRLSPGSPRGRSPTHRPSAQGVLFPLLIISSGRKTSVRCHLLWSQVIAVPGDLSLRHLQMLRQGPPSCRHPLKYTAPCSCLCPGSIVAFDPLSEEKADHCRAAAHARPGSSGVPSTRGWKWGPCPRKAASSSGEWPGTQTGARCSQLPGTLFWQQREAVKPRAIGIKEKLPSSQSRCLGLSLVRGFMALHLYLGGENTDPRPSSNCCEVRS